MLGPKALHLFFAFRLHHQINTIEGIESLNLFSLAIAEHAFLSAIPITRA